LCSYLDRLGYYHGKGCGVEVLSWERVWCGGVIMLEMCVPWLAVIGYPWFNVCSEWLQMVGGRVLCGGIM